MHPKLVSITEEKLSFRNTLALSVFPAASYFPAFIWGSYPDPKAVSLGSAFAQYASVSLTSSLLCSAATLAQQALSPAQDGSPRFSASRTVSFAFYGWTAGTIVPCWVTGSGALSNALSRSIENIGIDTKSVLFPRVSQLGMDLSEWSMATFGQLPQNTLTGSLENLIPLGIYLVFSSYAASYLYMSLNESINTMCLPYISSQQKLTPRSWSTFPFRVVADHIKALGSNIPNKFKASLGFGTIYFGLGASVLMNAMPSVPLTLALSGMGFIFNMYLFAKNRSKNER